MTNEQLIAELHDRQRAMYSGGPVQPVLDLLDPDIVWHVPGRSPIAGDHRGHRAVHEYFLTRRELANATMRLHPGRLLATAQAVVQLVAGSAQLNGEAVEWQTAGVYRIEAELVAEVWLVPLSLEQFDKLWIPDDGQAADPPSQT